MPQLYERNEYMIEQMLDMRGKYSDADKVFEESIRYTFLSVDIVPAILGIEIILSCFRFKFCYTVFSKSSVFSSFIR